ncbi:hypothetical protein R6Q57_017991 [Mikania cordata]
MADEGPSLPSNYVTILHLKERWLKQQQQSSKPNPNHHESDSNSTVKIPNESDSNSTVKISNESVHPRRNQPPIMNQPKPDVTPHNSPTNSVHRRRNKQPKPDVKAADNRQKIEKQKHQSTIKNSSRNRNPNQIRTEPEKKQHHQNESVAVKENASQRSDRRRGSGPAKTPPIGEKKKTIVSVWVRKGESASN